LRLLQTKPGGNSVKDKTILVVSAHAADYVWRSGGAIAKYIKNGASVHVVVLSHGVRGESNDLWDEPGQTVENVKKIRETESRSAAKELGVTHIEFWDQDDYPMILGQECQKKLLLKIRSTQPNIILTHDKTDILNPDHNAVHDFTFQCSVMSNSNGVITPGYPTTKQMAIYCFEPHQTEISNYTPGIFIDITESYEQKIAAMNCFKAQKHLIEYYTQRAFMRGNHARRLSGIKSYKYAESFAPVFPVIAGEFPCR
jgi:4-oxalomesaconate hydratase